MIKTSLKILTTISCLSISTNSVNSVLAASMTNPQLTGTDSSDYLLYCSNGTQTFLCSDSLSNILTGNSTAPGGNIELAGSSEQISFDFSKFTTLTGEIDSKSLTFSSLTAADWNSDLDGNGQTLSKDWLEAAFTNHGVDVSGLLDDIVQEFILQKGQQRFSDPNITYVNEESGVIKFGLAGYFNASNLLKEAFGDAEILGTTIADLVPSSVQASELVKVEYEGKYSYFYSFSATDSGQILNGSTNSHTGNYEMSFPLSALVNPLGVALVSTPEPITNIVSLFSVSVCGLLATRRKLD